MILKLFPSSLTICFVKYDISLSYTGYILLSYFKLHCKLIVFMYIFFLFKLTSFTWILLPNNIL